MKFRVIAGVAAAVAVSSVALTSLPASALSLDGKDSHKTGYTVSAHFVQDAPNGIDGNRALNSDNQYQDGDRALNPDNLYQDGDRALNPDNQYQD